MKAILFIQGCNVDGDTPADNCSFAVDFHTSNGAYSSNAVINVDITQSEAQINADIKDAVATLINTALGTNLNAADMRLF
jgi:hypothetical protein